MKIYTVLTVWYKGSREMNSLAYPNHHYKNQLFNLHLKCLLYNELIYAASFFFLISINIKFMCQSLLAFHLLGYFPHFIVSSEYHQFSFNGLTHLAFLSSIPFLTIWVLKFCLLSFNVDFLLLQLLNYLCSFLLFFFQFITLYSLKFLENI